jgi:hypothetical protein
MPPAFIAFQLLRYSLWPLSKVMDVDHLARNHAKLLEEGMSGHARFLNIFFMENAHAVELIEIHWRSP